MLGNRAAACQAAGEVVRKLALAEGLGRVLVAEKEMVKRGIALIHVLQQGVKLVSCAAARRGRRPNRRKLSPRTAA